MSSTTYIPHICDGLLSTQDKTSTLDRAVLLSGFDTTPVALGLHKNTAGFSILEINGNGKISKFTPTHVDSTRRHVLLGGNKVGFLARTSQSKRDLTSLTEDSHMILNVSTGTAVRVSGITGRLQDLVLLEAGLVIVGYASFFWLPRTGAYFILSFTHFKKIYSIAILANPKCFSNFTFRASSFGRLFFPLPLSRHRLEPFV